MYLAFHMDVKTKHCNK